MEYNVEVFQIEGWREPISGLTLAENEDWILVQHIPFDFFLDGYRLIRKSKVAGRMAGGAEALVARVFRLQEVPIQMPENFEWGDIEFSLRWTEKQYDLFQFQEDEEDEAVIGRVDAIADGYLEIVFVDDQGQEDTDYNVEYPLSRICVIEFGTNYLEGIRSLWKAGKMGA